MIKASKGNRGMIHEGKRKGTWEKKTAVNDAYSGDF